MFMMESVFFINKIAIIIFAAHSDMKKNIKFVLISREKTCKSVQSSYVTAVLTIKTKVRSRRSQKF